MPGRYTGFKSHATATSTATNDPKTFTAPQGAHGFYFTCTTNACWLTFDATTGTASNGLSMPKDSNPAFFPIGGNVTVTSQAAGNSVCNVAWIR